MLYLVVDLAIAMEPRAQFFLLPFGSYFIIAFISRVNMFASQKINLNTYC